MRVAVATVLRTASSMRDRSFLRTVSCSPKRQTHRGVPWVVALQNRLHMHLMRSGHRFQNMSITPYASVLRVILGCWSERGLRTLVLENSWRPRTEIVCTHVQYLQTCMHIDIVHTFLNTFILTRLVHENSWCLQTEMCCLYVCVSSTSHTP